MKIALFTQDEDLYLPVPIAAVVERHQANVTCLCLSPPMSTHGGGVGAVAKHLAVFGPLGSIRMAYRLARARWRARSRKDPKDGGYRSMEDIGRRHGIPTYRVARVNSGEMMGIVERHPADLLVSVSCPQIIRKKVLDRFPRGGINVHSAPLPRYRGLMPAFWTLYHGETETAVTVHRLADKLDNGAILLQRPVAVAEDETWESLVRKTKAAAGEALLEAIAALEKGTIAERPNPDEESTYFSFPTWRDALRFRLRGKRMF